MTELEPVGSPMGEIGSACAPDPLFGLKKEILTTPDGANMPRSPLPQVRPVILFAEDRAWRAACLRERGVIPGGYTYLAQLLGHDMGRSVPHQSVPHIDRSRTVADGPDSPAHYNLIENPLTLETVYGMGPRMLNHLYDPRTHLFRLEPGATISKFISTDGLPIRALYDDRNRDTLMLHELTVAWMQFHNRNAAQLMRTEAPGLGRPFTPAEAYALAREHAVHVWHGIVRADILPRFVLPEVMEIDRDEILRPEWQLDHISLLHGLFRAFHAMPLASYFLGRRRGGRQNLTELMRKDFWASTAEALGWTIDWTLFFEGGDKAPMTGISASADFRIRASGSSIVALDHATALAALPLRLVSDTMTKAREALPDSAWAENAKPENLARDFADIYGPVAPAVSATELGQGPLYQALMVEAQLHGPEGRFGPLGSVLFRASVEAAMLRTSLYDDAGALRSPPRADLPMPETMLDLIKVARDN